MKKIAIAFVLAACGGSSASKPDIEGTTLLVNLNSTQLDELCSYQTSVFGDPRTVTCTNDETVTVNSTTQCETQFTGLPTSCTATVANVEDCIDAVGSNPCNLETAPQCAPLFACATSD